MSTAAATPISASSLLPPANPSLYDEDPEDDVEAQQLQQAVTMWVQARKDSAAKKSSEIVGELHADVEAALKKAEAVVAKETKDAQKTVKTEFVQLEKELVEKYQEISAINDKYQKDVTKAWGEYQELARKLGEVKEGTSKLADKRVAGLKRKISQTQGEIGGMMAEAEKKLTKCRAQTSKMPGVMKMLNSLL